MTPLAMIVCGDRFYKDAVLHAIDTYQPDVVIDNIEASKGTADMIRRAVQAGVDARLYEGGHDGSGSTRSR